MKRKIMAILSVLIFVLFASCDDMGGNTEPFNSVNVFATYEEQALTVDVVSQEDASDPADGTCDVDVYYDDDILITVTSEANDNLSEDVVPSDVKIMSYTVEFTASEADSPDVPSKTIRHELLIAPDAETEVPVRIVDLEDKEWFSTHPLNHADYFNNAAIQYEYTVKVIFDMEEILSGRKETVEVDLPMYYFDVADDECS